MLTQSELKSKLNYNQDIGLFTWKHNSTMAGCYHTKGYIVIGIDNNLYLAHRLAWLYEHGEFPDGQIDHINHIKDDNRISNLRVVTNQDNHRNKSITKSNTSGVIGVAWAKRDKRWRARIMVDGKDISLGYFIEFHEAVNARKNAEVLYGFHKNHGKA